jgi:hypothetical protein
MIFRIMKHSTKTPSKRKTSSDPATAIKSWFGTVLIILSGCILYADKVIEYYDIQTDYEFKYYNGLDVFIWTLSGTISPLLMLLAYWFKPRRWALAVPISAYSVQLMYVFYDEDVFPKEYFWYYTVAFIFMFYLIIHVSRYALYSLTSGIRSLKEKIRFLMHLIGVTAEKEDLIKDDKKWNEEILKPALKKLDE